MTPRPIATGVDLVSVARVAGFVRDIGEPFLRRTWTAAELSDCGGDAERLAARWAAKEAVLKALGTGVSAVAMTDVEIVSEASGAPRVRLSGAAASRAAEIGLTTWSLSLSHESGLAVAVVVAVGED